MQTTSDLISIVMPVFNCTEYVRIMIDSILANTYQQWELWAVDDGSEADTLELLKSYSERDERIHFIQRSRGPKGAQTCRNMGMEHAQGEYIIFSDSDDYITSTCLQTRINAIRQHPELDFMIFPSGVLRNSQVTFDRMPSCYGFNVYKDEISAFARRTLPFVVVNNIYRTKSLREKGITWNTELRSMQDADFNLQTLLAGMKHDYCLCRADYGYRISGNAQSTSRKIASGKHNDTILAAISHFYEQITHVSGSKYLTPLYEGSIYLYNTVCASSYNEQFATALTSIIDKYDHRQAIRLKLKIALCNKLSSIIGYRRARQLSMLRFLLSYNFRKEYIIPRKIKKQIQ